MSRNYAVTLTREDLTKKYGITYVSPNGFEIEFTNVYGEKRVRAPHFCKATGYYILTVYDREARKAIPVEKRKTNSGQITLPMHRVVYAWYEGEVPAGMLVDHIDNDKTNNNIFNLQLLSPSVNLSKSRVVFKEPMKCNLKKPREFYVERIELYLSLVEKAKLDNDAKTAHKYRVYVSQYRAKLKYWDLHNDEVAVCK